MSKVFRAVSVSIEILWMCVSLILFLLKFPLNVSPISTKSNSTVLYVYYYHARRHRHRHLSATHTTMAAHQRIHKSNSILIFQSILEWSNTMNILLLYAIFFASIYIQFYSIGIFFAIFIGIFRCFYVCFHYIQWTKKSGKLEENEWVKSINRHKKDR